jgi:hypothetical protein
MGKFMIRKAGVLAACLAVSLSAGCALNREPDRGLRAHQYSAYSVGELELHNVLVVERAQAPIYKAGCTGRPLSTPGQRRRCGLAPFN